MASGALCLLVLAGVALDDGHDVVLWMAGEGALLGRKGNAEKMNSPIFGNLGELLKKYLHMGGETGICGTCIGFYKIDEKDLVEGMKKQTALWAVQKQAGRNCMIF